MDDIANIVGVSRYYMTRAFGVTGHPIMRYVRGRRMTEAARSVANGARDILTVALDAGYGSHEAFRIAAQKYAVFSHREHISTIRSIWSTILNKWLPESGHELVDAPDFERYGEEFDSHTGTGGLEIWVPVKA